MAATVDKQFIKKVLAEAINKAKAQEDEFGCNQLAIFCDYHNVNLSDVAHYVVELRDEKKIDDNFGKDLRCIEL